MKKKPKLNHVYEVHWIDHYASSDKSPTSAVDQGKKIMISYGKYVGYNRKYYIFAYNLDGDGEFENNDNMHILKNLIIKLEKLK